MAGDEKIESLILDDLADSGVVVFGTGEGWRGRRRCGGRGRSQACYGIGTARACDVGHDHHSSDRRRRNTRDCSCVDGLHYIDVYKLGNVLQVMSDNF